MFDVAGSETISLALPPQNKPKSFSPFSLGSLTSTDTRLPSWLLVTSMAAAPCLLNARFSTTTWTSCRSQDRISMDPSLVNSLTSGLPSTENRFSSRSTYLLLLADETTQPAGRAPRITNGSARTSEDRSNEG